jgi:hypothetical protein
MKSNIQFLDHSVKGVLVTFTATKTIIGVLYISHEENGRIRTSFESSEGHFVMFFVVETDQLLLEPNQRSSRYAERCIRSVWEEVKPHLLS